MAKARRRYRNYRKSTRWSANLTNVIGMQAAANANTTFQTHVTLCSNKSSENDMVSTVFTVKNIEFNGTITIIAQDPALNDKNNLEDITAYVMYVPQDMTVGPTYAKAHPEYI